MPCVRLENTGGVLEHPERSKLWPDMNLPEPGKRDEFGGFTVQLPQFWFGHKAEKASRFYIVGCDQKDIEIPFTLGEATHVLAISHGCKRRPEITKSEREHTPILLAHWLVDVARRCAKSTAIGR